LRSTVEGVEQPPKNAPPLFCLLNPIALYCGLVSLAMMVMHGAAWLAFKSDGLVAARAQAFGGNGPVPEIA
jgi:cytochrome bd ubiquinol oxidase subunit II